MLKTIKYRNDIKLFDIVTIDECKYIAIEISYEQILLETLTNWIMSNSYMAVPEGCNAPMTIAEFVRMKELKFLKDRDRGLTVDYKDSIKII